MKIFNITIYKYQVFEKTKHLVFGVSAVIAIIGFFLFVGWSANFMLSTPLIGNHKLFASGLLIVSGSALLLAGLLSIGKMTDQFIKSLKLKN